MGHRYSRRKYPINQGFYGTGGDLSGYPYGTSALGPFANYGSLLESRSLYAHPFAASGMVSPRMGMYGGMPSLPYGGLHY